MAYITNIGRSQWYLVPAATGVLRGRLGRLVARRQARQGAPVLAVRTGSLRLFIGRAFGLLVNAIKVLFGRARPRLLDQVGAHYFDPLTFGYLNASFPSGHSTTVGAIVGILIIWYPRWSLLIIELGLFFAATRIAAQAHYPSDVVAGFLVGLFFSIGLARWLAGRGVVFRFEPRKILPGTAGALDEKIPAVVIDRRLTFARMKPSRQIAVSAAFGAIAPVQSFVLDQRSIMAFDAFS